MARVYSGVIAVYKPRGMGSAAVTNTIKKLLKSKEFSGPGQWNKKIKVGHGGTLDREAQGVMVIGINDGTKQMTSMLSGGKKYKFGGILGVETDTLDVSGTEVRTASYDHINWEDFSPTLAKMFTGNIMQAAPIFSALKRGGQRLSDLQRQSDRSDSSADATAPDTPQPREVVCDYLELSATAEELPNFHGECHCQGGFYIRSLVRDIGVYLGSVANTTYIERTTVGKFNEEVALRYEDWTVPCIMAALSGEGPRYPRPPVQALETRE